MSKLISILKSPNIKVALLLIVILCLAYFGGSLLRLSFLFRAGIAVFLIMMIVIIILILKMKKVQKAGNIEQSISTNGDSNYQNLSPEKKKEIDQFRKQLESAITSLKKSKLGKGKSGRAALYALPWYMVIGPSAAGKTTAIQNSGLEFPIGKEAFRGVGGTRNCDWFFSTKGIFLDTAGRYVTEDEDNAEWISFLDVLKKNRIKKPINGVLVALNVDEIINSDKNSLYEHAKNIRTRIDELIENLGVNFPVYFIFTKCDLIQGFVEFFSDLSEIERSQIWGASFSSHQMSNSNARDLFENEFAKLTDRLFEIRTNRLSGRLKREQRRKVFLFPFQFKSLHDKLHFLIGEVFQQNPYRDNPLFRGFYFTSGTQEGIPLDLAIKEIAKQFNLPLSAGELEDEDKESVETKHYFIKDLLNDVVIEDQDFHAGYTSSLIKQQSASRLTLIAASILIFLLFTGLSYIGYNGSEDALENISKASISFSQINWNGNLLSNFKNAENLRNTIIDVENGDAVHSLVSFGMDRTDRTKNLLENLYIKKTNVFFNQNIYSEIERTLNNFADGQDYSIEDIYNYLKAYLLLGTERTRLKSADQKFLQSVFLNILQTKYISSNQLASGSVKDSLKLLFRNYLEFTTNKLQNRDIYPQTNNKVLVDLVRGRLQYQPGPENTYARLKQNASHQFSNDLTLEQIIGGRFSYLIKTDSKISYIFTADGWKNYMREAIVNESINPEKEDWVLGKQQFNVSFKKPDSEEIKNELTLMYLNDYKQNWIEFIKSIRYSGFENVPSAAANLKILGDPVGSPLILAMKTFATQLQIITDIVAPDSSQKNSASKYAGSFDITEINKYRSFVLAPDGSVATDLNAIIAQYGVLAGVLELIQGGLDLTKNYAANLLNQRAQELPAALKEIKGISFKTAALQNVFTEPVRLAWYTILNDAVQFLNTEWKNKVVDEFNKSMSNTFPFKETGNDAPIDDFKKFFEPQNGTLWTFVNNELNPFVNTNTWSINQWENQGIGINKELISTLKRAGNISSALFKNGDLNISFRLKPQIPKSEKINGQMPFVEQVYLSLDNDEKYYKMGAPFWADYTWPGSKGVPGARMNLSIRNYGLSETKKYDGEWALFHLFSDAIITSGETSSQYVLKWIFKKENFYDVTVIYLLSTGSTRNPFASNFFTSFHLPGKIN